MEGEKYNNRDMDMKATPIELGHRVTQQLTNKRETKEQTPCCFFLKLNARRLEKILGIRVHTQRGYSRERFPILYSYTGYAVSSAQLSSFTLAMPFIMKLSYNI